MQDIDVELARRTHPRPTFADCAARYLVQSREKRSLQAIEVHLRALLPHIGHLEPHQVHDETLRPFVSQRIASCVTAITINRSLEVVRTILTRAARSYRDEDGRPWLEMLPPLITILPESPRTAYPITWDEQDRLFPKLPPHLQRMALFAVNTGLRDSNVCGLESAWEVPVPEIGRSVFVIPSDSYKANRHHVVILNDAAWSIVQAQRGLHPTWVFPYRGRRINTMNNTAWQKVRREAGLRYVRTGLDLPVDVALFLPGAAPPLRVDTAYAERQDYAIPRFDGDEGHCPQRQLRSLRLRASRVQGRRAAQGISRAVSCRLDCMTPRRSGRASAAAAMDLIQRRASATAQLSPPSRPTPSRSSPTSSSRCG